MTSNKEILSHYTQFPVLLNILEHGKIVPGNPANWDDKTDYKILEKYAKGKNMKDIGALCLTEFPKGISDNLLHWKVYAPGKSGCRIDFYKKELEKLVKKQGLALKRVDYRSTLELETLPKSQRGKPLYLKRSPYIYENEWRILWFGNLKKDCCFGLDISQIIPLSNLIKCVKLSPELPKNLAKSLRIFLKEHYKITAEHSWIFDNPNWERAAKKSFPSTLGDKK